MALVRGSPLDYDGAPYESEGDKLQLNLIHNPYSTDPATIAPSDR